MREPMLKQGLVAYVALSLALGASLGVGRSFGRLAICAAMSQMRRVPVDRSAVSESAHCVKDRCQVYVDRTCSIALLDNRSSSPSSRHNRAT